MQITVAMRKNKEGAFDGALFIDHKFTAVAVNNSIEDLFSKLAGAHLSSWDAAAMNVAITVGVSKDGDPSPEGATNGS